MEMHQVRYFLAAARLLNFTRAAIECNVSQPSLTRAVQKLEEEFGGLLFRRERSLTHLTELGRMMVPHLERTYESAQAARMLAKGIGKDVQAPVALGVEGSISPHLRAVLSEVAAALPGFRLSLVKGDAAMLIEEMLKGDIDASVMIEPRESHDRLDRIEMLRQDFGILARADSELARAGFTDVQTLCGTSWIEGNRDVAMEFREWCQNVGAEPEFRHTAASELDLIELVAAGLGYAVAPAGLALPKSLVLVTVEDFPMSRTTVFATVAGRKRSAAADALARAIRARAWADV